MAGVRARRRALGVPEHVTSVFGNVVPLTRIFIESEVTSVRSTVSGSTADGRSIKDDKRVQIKARMMDDGPSQRQRTTIISLWIGMITIAPFKVFTV